MSLSLRSVPRSLAREFVLLAASTGLYQVSRLSVGLLAAASLEPSEYGAWGVVLALLAYGTYANFGILSGANREIPRLIGAGQEEHASRIEEAAFAGTIGLALAMAVGGTGIALVTADPYLTLLVALVLAGQQLYLFGQTTLRARLRFDRASVQQACIALAFPVFSLPLLGILGVAALVVGQLVAFVVGAVLSLLLWQRQLRPRIDVNVTARLVRDGAPIMLAGALFSVLTTLDRWLTLGLVGEEALGFYTVAALVSSAILLAVNIGAQQLYPRMLVRHGAGTPPGELRSMALRHGGFMAAAVLLPVAAIIIVAPLVIELWLPAYRGAIPIVMVLPLGYLALAASSGFTNLLVTIGRARLYAACLAVALVAELVAAWALLSLGLGTLAVALGSVIGLVALATSAATVAYAVSRTG
ncbi:MAG TPA: oligosaccharide flippase family protein [Gemmatimonadales bacterium]|nr:oligosaccharide flippase family protein [Gemmatimonadales bacterium]